MDAESVLNQMGSPLAGAGRSPIGVVWYGRIIVLNKVVRNGGDMPHGRKRLLPQRSIPSAIY